MPSTLKSKRRAVLSILLLVTGFVSATLVYRTSAKQYETKQGTGQTGSPHCVAIVGASNQQHMSVSTANTVSVVISKRFLPRM